MYALEMRRDAHNTARLRNSLSSTRAITYQYRVTKYNPTRRDIRGALTQPEWTTFDDVGMAFDGRTLTEADYLHVENAYIEAALCFLHEAGIASLNVRGLENSRNEAGALSEGTTIPLEELRTPFRDVLRALYRCRFEKAGQSFVHFGDDYHMYIGVNTLCTGAIHNAIELGLFVEDFTSPCHPENESF